MSKKMKSASAAAAKINTQSVAIATTTSIAPFQAVSMNIPLSMIDPSPFNPRKTFAEIALNELADSIRQHEVQTDIKVRPTTDGRYQIVYGERRWRASQLAGKDTIPAKVEQMTDEQAENCAIIENMQRENFTPFEEGEIFTRKATEYKMTIEAICNLFDKSKGYVQTRMNLLKLIPEVAEMLNGKTISLEVAKEFSNYDKKIQKEVFDEHFKSDGYNSWRGIAAKDFAKKLYDRYMTKLDQYHFDKEECTTCTHNTANQVLFTMCGDCAGCKKPSCLQKKNTAYLVQQCIDLTASDPRIQIAVSSDSDVKAATLLTEAGHEITKLEKALWRYQSVEDAPDMPVREDFEDADEWKFATEEYEQELSEFQESMKDIEKSVAEGGTLKLAVLGANTVKIYYDKIQVQTAAIGGITYTNEPTDPASKLKTKDVRNHSICFEHITSDLKKVIRCDAKQFPRTEITPREEQFLYYVLLHRIHRFKEELLGLKNCGYKPQEDYLKLVENLTPEQKTVIVRLAIMEYCGDLTENFCKPESVDIKLMTEFADLHFPEQSKAVQEKHKTIYDKRHTNLAVRIKALENEAELLRLKALAESKGLMAQTDGTFVDSTTGEVLTAEEAAAITTVAEAQDNLNVEPQVVSEPETAPGTEEPAYKPEEIPEEPQVVSEPAPESEEPAYEPEEIPEEQEPVFEPTPVIPVPQPEYEPWVEPDDAPEWMYKTIIPDSTKKGKQIRLGGRKTAKAA